MLLSWVSRGISNVESNSEFRNRSLRLLKRFFCGFVPLMSTRINSNRFPDVRCVGKLASFEFTIVSG